MSKTYAIGDIHGRLDLLVKALDIIAARDPAATVVTLGDYIDRGPQSRGVLDELQANPRGLNLILLKGNHEVLMYEALRDRYQSSEEIWLSNGGVQTTASYMENGELNRSAIEVHLDFIKTLKLYHSDDHRFFVHAKVIDGYPLSQQETHMLWSRYEHLDHGGYNGKHVVHGHTPHRFPELKDRRTNLDTGAVFYGILTVAVFEDDKPGGPVDLIRVKL